VEKNEKLSIFVSGPHVEFYKYFQLFLGSTESFSGQSIIQGDNRKEINSCFFCNTGFHGVNYFIPLACFLTQN
jgi:heme/copper-type cytochrome/quinol oxidase subunit 3